MPKIPENWYNIGDKVYAFIWQKREVVEITITGVYYDHDENAIFYNSEQYLHLKQGRDIAKKMDILKSYAEESFDECFKQFKVKK